MLILQSTRLKLNGFVFGTVAAITAYSLTQRNIWKSSASVIEELSVRNKDTNLTKKRPEDAIMGRGFRIACLRKWNEGVDYVFGGLATELTKRGL